MVSIGWGAFAHTGLTIIAISSDHPFYSMIDGVLLNKKIKKLHTYLSRKTDTTYVVPDGVQLIGDMAFVGCENLITVILPNSVTSIGNDAFSTSNLSTIILSTSLTTIGYGAFSFIPLTQIMLPDSVVTIGNDAFTYTELTSIIIPDSVTSIGDGAFAGSYLTAITIPSSVITIGD